MSKEFRDEFSQIANRQVEHKISNFALFHFVLPLAIAILGVCSPYLWSINYIIPVTLWFFLAIVYGLSWWKSHPTYNDVHRLLLHKQRDDLKISKLNQDIEYFHKTVVDLNNKNLVSFIFRAMSLAYINSIKSSGIDKKYFCEILDELLSPLYLQGDAVFGFSMSERWSIGVYIFDKENNVLKSVWRQKSNSHPSEGTGRDWIPGEGHVGKAFIDRLPIVTGNANDEAVSRLCRPRGSKHLTYDNSTYVSFASVPISASQNDDDDPFGVLVVTSNREDRLSEVSTELLMHAAQTIAVILDLSDADIGCLINPNHDISGIVKGENHVGSAEEA